MEAAASLPAARVNSWPTPKSIPASSSAASCLAWKPLPRPVRRIAASCSEQGQHARTYVAGLLSQLESKNVESIAYLHDQEREPLQQFIGQSPWDAQLWLAELARQVGQQLGSPDGVLVFDPSAFPKKGNASVGVQRQWCGRLGKLDNCQVGLYLAYVGRAEHALVDVRLYLPEDWAKDKERRTKAGIPKGVSVFPHAARAGPGDAGPAAAQAAAPRVDFRRRRDGP